jgi:hypothetical protein
MATSGAIASAASGLKNPSIAQLPTKGDDDEDDYEDGEDDDEDEDEDEDDD